mmetsp:Transcript_23442/g.69650  ORF Transcript_23442/g.69650 Transcript_23442/m.69650 type:complete len:292 (+) Transcript_23442:315-1190(+)
MLDSTAGGVSPLPCALHSCPARKCSACSAAMQPVPAAVMACRHFLSWTSPQAKTPGTLVVVSPGVVLMYPSSSSFTWPPKNLEAGSCPIAKKRPLTSSSEMAPVFRFLILMLPSSPFSLPMASATSLSQINSIFSFALARCCMIFEARSVSRRWMTYTLLPYLVRKWASSIAESPPPMTAMGFFRKMGAAPSHTAQAEIPLFQKPFSSPLPGNSRRRATAPVAMITVCAVTSFSSVHSLNGRLLRSTLVIVSVKILVPKRKLCLRMFSTSSVPSMPSGKPGKFSTSVVVVS